MTVSQCGWWVTTVSSCFLDVEVQPRPWVTIGAVKHPHLPSTQAAVMAVRAIAREHGLELRVADDIGTGQTSRRLSAGAFTVRDPDGSLCGRP